MIAHLLVEKHFMPTLIPTLSYSLSRNAPIVVPNFTFFGVTGLVGLNSDLDPYCMRNAFIHTAIFSTSRHDTRYISSVSSLLSLCGVLLALVYIALAHIGSSSLLLQSNLLLQQIGRQVYSRRVGESFSHCG